MTKSYFHFLYSYPHFWILGMKTKNQKNKANMFFTSGSQKKQEIKAKHIMFSKESNMALDSCLSWKLILDHEMDHFYFL